MMLTGRWLEGLSALITGADRGIGQGIALRFAVMVLGTAFVLDGGASIRLH